MRRAPLVTGLGCYLLENAAIAQGGCMCRSGEPLRPIPDRATGEMSRAISTRMRFSASAASCSRSPRPASTRSLASLAQGLADAIEGDAHFLLEADGLVVRRDRHAHLTRDEDPAAGFGIDTQRLAEALRDRAGEMSHCAHDRTLSCMSGLDGGNLPARRRARGPSKSPVSSGVRVRYDHPVEQRELCCENGIPDRFAKFSAVIPQPGGAESDEGLEVFGRPERRSFLNRVPMECRLLTLRQGRHQPGDLLLPPAPSFGTRAVHSALGQFSERVLSAWRVVSSSTRVLARAEWDRLIASSPDTRPI